MKCLIGIKKGMTQIYDADGVCHPVTVLKVPSSTVAAVRSYDQDGYDAVLVAAGEQKEHRLSKARKGAHGNAQIVREFRAKHGQEVRAEAGSTADVAQFSVGDLVEVSATSKGKGFQGVVKRHGFSGGPKTHGNKHHERAPGSIGSTGPSRVFKGTRMAGRMGGDRVTVKNLRIVHVQPDENMLLVRGAVPGRNGAVVEVRSV